jgi:hypothetical protein
MNINGGLQHGFLKKRRQHHLRTQHYKDGNFTHGYRYPWVPYPFGQGMGIICLNFDLFKFWIYLICNFVQILNFCSYFKFVQIFIFCLDLKFIKKINRFWIRSILLKN